MSAGSLRESIAKTRRERRRLERELNRVGMVLVRLEAHRETHARAGVPPADGLPGAGAATDPVVVAWERFVGGDADETPADRRDALAYLTEALLDDPGRGGTVDFFGRARTYRTEAGVSDRVARVVAQLDRFVSGDGDPDRIVEPVRRLVGGSGTPADLEHLHAIVGFAATATRRKQEQLVDRLNSDFDGTDVTEAGLLEAYLAAVGDDPLSALDEQPIVVLPVRLETRFVQVTRDGDEVEVRRYGDGEGPAELRVRVFPDQVHLDAHETELTDEEVRWGKTFWAQLWYACHHVEAPPEDGDDPRQLPYNPKKLPAEVEDWGVVETIDETWDTFSLSWPARYAEIKERAWRRIVERFGRERAAYVVHTLRPKEGADQLLAAGEEDEHPWEERNAKIPDLGFPDVPRRPDSWTAQPRARLLPDRWVAHATWRPDRRGGGSDGGDSADGEDADDGDGDAPSDAVRHVSVSSHAVREPLAMGPDPETVGAMADDATGEGEAADGLGGPPPGLEWLVDFDEAVRAGMAMTITEDDLGADPATGTVESLLVVGVKTSMSSAESVESLRELLDAHHYSEGLEFLEGGTPTNNADVPSAYASADDPVGSMATEIGAPLVESSDYSDGDRLARALGVEPEAGEPHVFAHVGNADGRTDRAARHMNNALWPATLGYTLKHVLVDNRWGPGPSLWEDVADVDAAAPPDDPTAATREGLSWLTTLRRHFVSYVRGGGPFPSLRVGEQPYGVLPVTPLSSQADEADDATFTWYDAAALAPVYVGEDDDSADEAAPQGVTDFAPDLSGRRTFGSTLSGFGTDRSVTDDFLTDGAGGFVPRYLDRKDDLLVPPLATWVDRFSAVWRDAVQQPPEAAPTAGDEPDREPVRPVPRIEDGTVPLVEVLQMESASSDYLRQAVFTDPTTIWTMVGANDDDITRADLRTVISEVDPDVTGAELDAMLADLDAPSGTDSHYAWWGRLYPKLLEVRDDQRREIRETLRRYDLTALDPRASNFLYEDALTGGLNWRTLGRLVDEDDDLNLWLLQQLSYRELRTMGYDETAPGAPSSAVRKKRALVDEQRARFPGTEPVVQKSLLRVLLRFSTMQEYVTGRIQLGALYDDPVDLGPDPVHPPAGALDESWFDELFDLTPPELAAHPELDSPDIDTGAGTYLDALEYFRGVGATDSPVPEFGDFTYSLNQLENFPVDELERQFTRSLDVASHRLDAWWTSIATRRLFELRRGQGSWIDRHRVEAPHVRLGYRRAAAEAPTLYEAAAGGDGEGTDEGGSKSGSPTDATSASSPTSPSNAELASTSTTESKWKGVFVPESEFDASPVASAGGAVTDVDASTGPVDEGPGIVGSGELGDVGHDVDSVSGQLPGTQSVTLPDAETASYVGAYGFVEGLEPDPEEGDTEFVHAPSTQHATTATLLRSAYQSHEGSELADALAIDLSADRVRLANGLLEGVRNGQSLGALLGYRFERALHEDEAPLQQYIPAFRKLAPGLMGRLEHGGEPPGDGEGDGEGDGDGIGDTAAKSDVVDGYELYRQYTDDEIPFLTPGEHEDGKELSDAGLPLEDTVDHVFSAALEVPIDALADLLTAESVHQLAKGNVERASGSVDSLVEGRIPQEPEVTRTTRSSTGITHRQLVLFDVPATGGPLDVPGGWETGSMQVRPGAEPLLNAWVATLLPDPGDVTCTGTFRWTDDAGAEQTEETTASLSDLALSPLDALYLTQDAGQAGTSQLEGRFDYFLRRRRRESAPVDAELLLGFATPASDDGFSVAAFLELAGAVRTLVLDGRAADGEDLAHPADGLGAGLEASLDGGRTPAGVLADRIDDATSRLGTLREDVVDRLALLDPPGGEANLLARVDAAVEAVGAFAQRITPRTALATEPTAIARLDAFEDRVDAVDGVLTADDAMPDELLDELRALPALLPAGPTEPEKGEVAVEPGVPLEGTAESVDTGDPPGEVDLEAWSRSPTSGYHATVEGVAVDPSGGFAVTLDVSDVEPGTPIQVVGRAGDSIVYSAQARVSGDGPDPDALSTALADDLPTLAALFQLAAIRDRLEATDGPGATLQDAIDALEDAPHPTAGTGTTAITAERTLIEALHAAGETTLSDADLDAIGAMEALVGTGDGALPGAAGVELSVVVEDLGAVLAPVDRLGLSDLVLVTSGDGGVTYRQGSDRAAEIVRRRLATVDPDPRYLTAGGNDVLLDVDPTVARFVEETVGRYAGWFVASLEDLLYAPDWFPAYLDRYVDGPDELLYHLSLLLYHPDRFVSATTPSAFADRIEALADALPTMDRLTAVLGLEGRGARFAFETQLRAFHAAPGSGTDLESFLSALVEYYEAPESDRDLEALHASLGLADPDGRATFVADYGATLDGTTGTGPLAGLTGQLDLVRAVLDADDPAGAVRAGVYETVRRRLLRASYFGVYGTVPQSVDGGDPGDEATLLGQLRAARERIDDRLPGPDAVEPDALAAPDLADRLEALFGEQFVVLPPFVAPNAGELERTFGADLLGDQPLAAETWLQRAAHVRERPAAFREAYTYAEAATGTLRRDFSVGQLPETGLDAWVGLDDVVPSGSQVSLVVQAGNDVRFTGGDGGPSSFAGGMAGLFVDEWVEPVPSDTGTTGIALNFDDPGNRAPQSILVAVPPATGEWSDEHLRTAVSETFGLAKLRLVDREALAAVEDARGLEHLLPALWFPRVYDPQPFDPSVNFDALKRLAPDVLDLVEGALDLPFYWPDGSADGAGDADSGGEGT